MAFGNQRQHQNKGCIYSRQEKHSGRSIIHSKNSSIRMDPKRYNSTVSVQHLGSTNDRSLCISRQSQDTSLLHLVSSQKGSSSGCPVNIMGGYDSICISSDMSHPKSSTTHVSVSLSDSVKSTSMAQTPLEHKSTKVINSRTKKVTSWTRKAVQPKTKIFHPDPGIFKLKAWLLSTETSKLEAFQNMLKKFSQPFGGKEHKRTISVNFHCSVAGILKKIPIQILQLTLPTSFLIYIMRGYSIELYQGIGLCFCCFISN